jgi:uncharacterized protein YdeI (BOF family)
MKLGFTTTLALAAALVFPVVALASPLREKMAQATIGDLQRTNSTTISGEVVRVQGDDFILSDGTGQILVEAETRPIREANLRVGDRVTVAGQYDDDNSFEALSITPSNGNVIYVFDD